MNEQFLRSEMLLGESSTEKLNSSRVILFGVGGVGSYTAEALARAGVGNITLVDNDCVSLSNINRQLCALHSTVGKDKVSVVTERIKDINPDCKVTALKKFYLPDDCGWFNPGDYDYVADAIDTVSAKLDIAEKCFRQGVPVISCMGTGNKLNPSLFRISDIYKTSVCPLCRVMRAELKKMGVTSLNVVWSDEVPVKPASSKEDNGRVPGSVSFVPGAAGLLMASKIITDLAGNL